MSNREIYPSVSLRVVVDDFWRIQMRLSEQAIMEWDLHGEGSFQRWVTRRLLELWIEVAELN